MGFNIQNFIWKITNIQSIRGFILSGLVSIVLWFAKGLWEAWFFNMLLNPSAYQTILTWATSNPYIIIFLPISIGVAVVLISTCVEMWDEQRNPRKLLISSLTKLQNRMLGFADRRLNRFMTFSEFDKIMRHVALASKLVSSSYESKIIEKEMMEQIGVSSVYETINEEQANQALSIFLQLSNEVNDPQSASAMDNVLDTYNRSIFRLRDSDGQFKQLINIIHAIELYFADNQLTKVTDDFILKSYQWSILSFFRKLIDKFIPEGIVLTEFAQHPSFNLRMTMDTQMNGLLQQIVQRVDILSKSRQKESKRRK